MKIKLCLILLMFCVPLCAMDSKQLDNTKRRVKKNKRFSIFDAVEHASPTLVELIVRTKVNPNTQRAFSWTALTTAVDSLFKSKKPDLKTCIKILLYYGADPTIRVTDPSTGLSGCYNGKNAIDLAQEYHLDDVVQWLQHPLRRKECCTFWLKRLRPKNEKNECIPFKLPEDMINVIVNYAYGFDINEDERRI